ncbi:MAG: hypothetical protein IKN72_11195 [Clostridia bacterium]|nr:hypothetical protein [Clostridia bacterium]
MAFTEEIEALIELMVICESFEGLPLAQLQDAEKLAVEVTVSIASAFCGATNTHAVMIMSRLMTIDRVRLEYVLIVFFIR